MKPAISFACALLLSWQRVARADEPPAATSVPGSSSPAAAAPPKAGVAPASAAPRASLPPAAQPDAQALSPAQAADQASSAALLPSPRSQADAEQAGVQNEVLPPPSARPLLVVAGVGTFALWYGAAVAESYAWSKADAAEKLRIPVVGPWMTLAKAGCSDEENNCTTMLAVVRGVLAGFSGVGQVGGLALLSEALLTRTGPSATASQSVRLHAAVKGFTFATERDGLRVGVYGAF